MNPETIVAIAGGIIAVVGAFWRAMSILSALERKVDGVAAKLDLHVLQRLGALEEDVKDLSHRHRSTDRQGD